MPTRARTFLTVLLPLLAFGVALLVLRVAPTPPLQYCHKLELGRATAIEGRCYERGIASAMRDHPGMSGPRHLDGVAHEDRVLYRMCHQEMHAYGRRDGHRLARAGTWKPTSADVRGNCLNGYLHGRIEGFVERAGYASIDQDLMLVLCPTARKPLDRAACAHGVGHGLWRREKSQERVATSVAMCERSMQPPASLDCGAGVMMQDGIEAIRDAGDSAVSYARYCRRVAPDHELTCMRFYYGLSQFGDSSAAGLGTQCERLPRASDSRYGCVLGIGRQREIDLKSQRTPCAQLRHSDDTSVCVYGSVVNAIYNDRAALTRLADYCGRLQGDSGTACTVGAGRMYAFVGSSASSCSGMSSSLRPVCDAGTRLADLPLDGAKNEVSQVLALVAAHEVSE